MAEVLKCDSLLLDFVLVLVAYLGSHNISNTKYIILCLEYNNWF